MKVSPESRSQKDQIDLIHTARYQKNLVNVLIDAHRGGNMPENTIKTFLVMIDHGIPSIEFDVWYSKDKVPVVIHGVDQGVIGHSIASRGISPDTPINDILLEDLKLIELPEGQRIPTFEEVIIACGNLIHLNIELKEVQDISIVQCCIDLLEKHEVSSSNYHFSGFIQATLDEAVRIRGKEIQVCYLFNDKLEDILPKPEVYTAKGTHVGLDAKFASKDVIDSIQAAGKKAVIFFYWRQEDEELVNQLIYWGADTLITDFPIEMKKKFLKLEKGRDDIHTDASISTTSE